MPAHPRLRTVCLNAACRIQDYWNVHRIPLRLYRLNCIYARQLAVVGHNMRELITHPEFTARIEVIELTTFQRLLIPKAVWADMPLERRLEFLDQYQQPRQRRVPIGRKKTPQGERAERRRALEAPPTDFSFLPATDAVERPTIDELIRARRLRNG